MKALIPLARLTLLGGLSLLALVAAPSDTAAQPAAQADAAVKPPSEFKTPSARPLPPSVREGLIPAQTDLRLPAPDLTEVRREDKETDEQLKMRRVGIRRELPAAVTLRSGVSSHGRWIDRGEEGQAWTLTLDSEEALGTRLLLEEFALPPGAQLWVYATDDPEQFVGPVTTDELFGELEHWTATVFASRTTLELTIPPTATRSEVELRVSELVHFYVPLDELAREIHKEDTCYNDATCDTDYANESDGIALIITVTPLGTFQCTGCLLNDFDPDTWADYFLTANHCLSGNNTNLAQQTAANSMEFYWFFQTSVCDGTPPNLGSVPRTTGGAQLLHSATAAAGNDAAFVRLRTTTPGGVMYMGWTTGSPSVGASNAGLHHPDGTFLRLSYGNLNSSNANYWLNVWNSGSTEGGSSGSPLLDSNKRVIGQLQGGPASCSYMIGEDWYGRYNVTYPNIQHWMEIGGTIHVDDSYSGVERGTPTQPFNTVTEGYNLAWRETRILIQGGSYNEALTMTKQVTLLGANGAVTIGN